MVWLSGISPEGATTPIVPMLAALWPSSAQICRRKTETEVFPLVPVTAAITFGCAPKYCRGDARKSKPGIFVCDEAHAKRLGDVGRMFGVPSTATAPRFTASDMNARPSARVPGSAANR